MPNLAQTSPNDGLNALDVVGLLALGTSAPESEGPSASARRGKLLFVAQNSADIVQVDHILYSLFEDGLDLV